MEKRKYTRWEKLSNWFYYNKLYVAIAALILYVLGSMVWNALGIGQVHPDHYVAYVGSRRLPEDCVSALEAALTRFGEDVNGDGTVCVRLSQHITAGDGSVENAVYSYGAEVTLLADITMGESYLFLMEDPEWFQKSFQVLAHWDGSIPEETDYSAQDKVIFWQDCPSLAALDLGSYRDVYLDREYTGECQDLLANLYLGRRYYHNKAPGEADEQLWSRMTAEARR